MSRDALSDLLRAVRLRGAVFYYVSNWGEWAAEASPADEIAAAVMPGAEHVMEFHMVAKGGGKGGHEKDRIGYLKLLPRGKQVFLAKNIDIEMPKIHKGGGAGAAGDRRHRDVPSRRRTRDIQRARGEARAHHSRLGFCHAP